MYAEALERLHCETKPGETNMTTCTNRLALFISNSFILFLLLLFVLSEIADQ